MSEATPARRPPWSLIITGILALLICGYVLCVHYTTAKHSVFALGHRLTPENVPLILSSIAWPLAVVASVFMLRVALRSLIDRIKSASVGGDNGPVIEFDRGERSVAAPAAEAPKAVGGVTFKDRVRENVANTYWVGADLMTLFDVILRGGKRDEMLKMFRQVNHHLKVLRMKDAPLYDRFRRLYDSAEKSLESDWSSARRLEVAREVHSITGAFGRLIEETQPGFSGDAQTSAAL